jgi:MFS family permease
MSDVRQPLPRNVKALSVVSLLTDVSSEMIYPLLPIFLTTVLGASAAMIGTIEGFAESTAALLKLASGWWSDRVRRKPLVLFGYGLAAIMRPLVGLATSASQVLAIRVSDRVGKGIRTSPRDALLADAADPAERGRAFGFHRSADNLGAVLGPLIAWLLLQHAGVAVRSVFLWSAIPGVLAIVVLLVFVKEKRKSETPIDASISPPSSAASSDSQPLGSSFWKYLVVLLLFTLGGSTDAFLLLRASQLGVAAAMIPLLWAAHSLVKSVTNTPGGMLSDKFGRRPLIVTGWIVYAIVYLLFGRATSAWQMWALFLAYGLYFGLTEGAEKALVTDLVPASKRGTAFGWYNFTVGLAALPASVVFGIVWDRFSPAAAFGMGATLAGVAAVGLMLVVPDAGRKVIP